MVSRLKSQWQAHTTESAFAILAIVFGLLFVLIVPPTQAADEKTHFHRAYEISQGHILSKSQDQGYGDYMPRDVYNTSEQLFANIPSHYDRTFNYAQVKHLLKQKINFNDKVFVHLEGSTVYSPIPYLPQVVAIEFSKIVWPSTVLMYYLGRLANLAVWILLVYIAIRIWPSNKWPIFVLALTPMSLSQAATNSPDALGNALAFLTISAAIYFANKRRKIGKSEITFLLLGIVLLSLSKPVFFILAALGLLFSPKQLGGIKKYVLFMTGLTLSGLIATGLWNSQVKAYGAGITHYYYPTINIDEKAQIVHILTHPFYFIFTLGRTYLSSLGDIVSTSFIGKLGWIDTALPVWVIVLTFILIVLAIINRDPSEKRFNKKTRYVALATFLFGFLATSVILYITISSVGDSLINNVQGRYFIAFTPLLVPAFFGILKVHDWDKIALRLFPVGYVIILSTTLIVVANRFL
jgi:uncharacterized membrane protein